jgi:hypothetical protein
VIDHQIHWHQWLDDFGIFLQVGDRRSHGGQVHQQRHASKILEHNAGDDKGDLLWRRRLRVPSCQRGDILVRDFLSVAIAENRFKHDSDTDRQSRDLPEPFFLQGRQRVVQAGLAIAGIKRAQCISHS